VAGTNVAFGKCDLKKVKLGEVTKSHGRQVAPVGHINEVLHCDFATCRWS